MLMLTAVFVWPITPMINAPTNIYVGCLFGHTSTFFFMNIKFCSHTMENYSHSFRVICDKCLTDSGEQHCIKTKTKNPINQSKTSDVMAKMARKTV